MAWSLLYLAKLCNLQGQKAGSLLSQGRCPKTGKGAKKLLVDRKGSWNPETVRLCWYQRLFSATKAIYVPSYRGLHLLCSKDGQELL